MDWSHRTIDGTRGPNENRTTTAAGQTGETEALILNNIGKGAPVYRPTI
jgi:hypothetical protein